jgi:hypothetical protein
VCGTCGFGRSLGGLSSWERDSCRRLGGVEGESGEAAEEPATGGRQAVSRSTGRTVTARVVRLSRNNWTVAEVARRRGGVVVVLGPVQQQLAGPRDVSLPCSRRRALSQCAAARIESAACIESQLPCAKINCENGQADRHVAATCGSLLGPQAHIPGGI